ncbi:MAG: ABC transporter permease [Treponema sp.]|nr:ABC transporter permease [Treponema sp.]
MAETRPAAGEEAVQWDSIIVSRRKLLDIRIRELIRYRDLVWLFIKRDFITVYKQTILGPLWYIINPLFSAVTYMFIFGNLARIGTDEIPPLLFYYSGTMLWTYFSKCLTDVSNVFIDNAGLFGKVYFPRLTVPISRVFSNLITLLIQFAALLCFYLWFIIRGAPARPLLGVLALPLIFAWIALLSSGIGMVISALTTKYRDLKQLAGFGLSLAMYATPVVYPLSQAPEKYRPLFYLNPMSAPVELFRLWFYGAGHAPAAMILASASVTLAFFLFGLILFNRNERAFVDVI